MNTFSENVDLVWEKQSTQQRIKTASGSDCDAAVIVVSTGRDTAEGISSILAKLISLWLVAFGMFGKLRGAVDRTTNVSDCI